MALEMAQAATGFAAASSTGPHNQDELHLISVRSHDGRSMKQPSNPLPARVEGRTVLPRSSPRPPPCGEPSAGASPLQPRAGGCLPSTWSRPARLLLAHTASARRRPHALCAVAAQGRSLKVVLLRTYLAMLSAAKKHYDAAGGAANAANPATLYDPPWLLQCTPELGAAAASSRTKCEAGSSYFRHKRVAEVDCPFVDRTIRFEAIELTSREPTNRVAQAKRRLRSRLRRTAGSTSPLPRT